MSSPHQNDFERLATERGSTGVASEMWYFLRKYKKWWMAPVLLVLLLLSVVMMLSTTAAAPFIYTLF